MLPLVMDLWFGGPSARDRLGQTFQKGDPHGIHVVLRGLSPFRTGSTSKDVFLQRTQFLFGSVTMPK